MHRPSIAASIGMVPEPQSGSTNSLPGFQNDSCTRAAASVSLIGASTFAMRYPRLCSPAPLVSQLTVTRFFRMRTRTAYFAPLFENRPPP